MGQLVHDKILFQNIERNERLCKYLAFVHTEQFFQDNSAFGQYAAKPPKAHKDWIAAASNLVEKFSKFNANSLI